MTRLINRLRAEREVRGWSQSRIAEAAGISRQSYSAIESGTAVPSTDISLKLSAAFGRAVEELFVLGGSGEPGPQASWAGAGRALVGRRVRLARIGGRLLALEAGGQGDALAGPADATIASVNGAEVELQMLQERPRLPDLVVAGCDPAFAIVARSLAESRRLEVAWWPRSSRAALEALANGYAHIAGAHLQNVEGLFDEALMREIVPFPCIRISFAVWEQGLLVAPGNPLGIAGVDHLSRADVRVVNREPGSGSRALLDARLHRANIEPDQVRGYDSRAGGHLQLAGVVASGAADAGVAIRAAGATFGLEVLALAQESYELVVPDHFFDSAPVQALIDALSRPGIRGQVEALGGYDASAMGRQAG